MDRPLTQRSAFFVSLQTGMKKKDVLTHKEAVRRALEELGGRARLRDIYPRVIPHIVYKPGSDVKATLRRLLQTTPELFRHTEGKRGWWELVSFQEELAARDRKIEELNRLHITTEQIISGFNDYDTLIERIYAKQVMQMLFHGNAAWETAYKKMKKAGYFKDAQPQVILNNPQFRSLYEVTGNQEVKIGK